LSINQSIKIYIAPFKSLYKTTKCSELLANIHPDICVGLHDCKY